MTFSQKLIDLRRRQGLSQEELSQRMDVSRQAVSKWESGQTMPDVGKLVALARLFGVSLDYLLREEAEEPENEQRAVKTEAQASDWPQTYAYPCYEYKSRTKVGSWPLVHVKFKPHGMALAKGVIAIGNAAVGGIAIGGMSVGLISIAGLGAGVISLAGLSVGLLAAGGLSVGLLALGGVAIGKIAIGAVSLGRYGFGAAVIAEKFGAGAVVRAPIAVAEETNAVYALPIEVDRQTLAAFLDAYVPEIPWLLRKLILWMN